MVAPDYVARICKALAGRPDVVGLICSCTGIAAPFSIASTRWIGTEPGPWPGLLDGRDAFVRGASHLMPVRSELARQCSFQGSPTAWTHEDTQYAAALALLLDGATEEFIPDALYAYRWNPADTTQFGPQAPFTPGPQPVIASPCFRWLP